MVIDAITFEMYGHTFEIDCDPIMIDAVTFVI